MMILLNQFNAHYLIGRLISINLTVIKITILNQNEVFYLYIKSSYYDRKNFKFYHIYKKWFLKIKTNYN